MVHYGFQMPFSEMFFITFSKSDYSLPPSILAFPPPPIYSFFFLLSKGQGSYVYQAALNIAVRLDISSPLRLDNAIQ